MVRYKGLNYDRKNILQEQLNILLAQLIVFTVLRSVSTRVRKKTFLQNNNF